MAKANSREEEILRKLFISEPNIYNGKIDFVVQFVKLEHVSEINILLEFNKRYPGVYIAFNWDIFDKMLFRKKLIMYFEELIKIEPRLFYFEAYWRDCQCTVSSSLRSMLIDFAKKNKIVCRQIL